MSFASPPVAPGIGYPSSGIAPPTKPYTFAGVAIIPGDERRNFAVIGDCGTGKSVAIADIVDQVRARGRRMVIHDGTGALAERYYRAGKDILLDPMDARCAAWNVVADMPRGQHARMFAESLFQVHADSSSGFWIHAAQEVFADVVLALQERGMATTRQLYEAIALTSNEELFDLLDGRAGRVYINPQGSNQTEGVRSTISQAIESLRYLPTAGTDLSVREWVEDDESDSCIFLNSRPDERRLVMPLYAALMKVATMGAMERRSTRKNRIWFMLDDFPTLGRIDVLCTALACGHRFGLVAVVGFQAWRQLAGIYGPEGAQTIISNLQHRLVLRTSDGETAHMQSEFSELLAAGNNSSHVTPPQVQCLPVLSGLFMSACNYSVHKVCLRQLVE